jgi:hypothetical protein
LAPVLFSFLGLLLFEAPAVAVWSEALAGAERLTSTVVRKPHDEQCVAKDNASKSLPAVSCASIAIFAFLLGLSLPVSVLPSLLRRRTEQGTKL